MKSHLALILLAIRINGLVIHSHRQDDLSKERQLSLTEEEISLMSGCLTRPPPEFNRTIGACLGPSQSVE
jgi:hypothetical protein